MALPATGGGTESATPVRRNRGLAAAATLIAVAILAAWYFAADTLTRYVSDRDIDNFVLHSRDSSDQIATNLARNLQDEVRRLGNLPEVIAGDRLLREALDVKTPGTAQAAATIQRVNERLRHLAEEMEVDIVYVLDDKGLCIAASNYQNESSTIGTDLHARQYFTAIENGSRGRQFAFGSAANVPGVYFSAPIRNDERFLGGVVVKRAVNSLFRLTTRNAAFLVDEFGVIVATTVEQALWHYLPESAAAGLGGDFIQSRYHQASLSPLALQPDQSLATISLIRLPDDPVLSLMTVRPIGDSGLRLVYFTPLPDLVDLRQRGRVAFWLVFTLGCLALTLLAGAVSYVLQSRHRVKALRHSYQKLSALSRELAKEKETAMAADRAKSRFLATMSHELRTPFSGILGMVEMLRASDLPLASLEQVGLLERSARSLLGLLNDILDFSKIDAGQLRVERVSFDFGAIIADLGQIHGVVASGKGITLSVEALPDRLVGMGDPNRLRQVLNNFLSNAVKFTRHGSVRLRVSIAGEGEQRRLRVAVRDTGPGLLPEALDNLFTPFFQFDASTTRKHGGTGLGLAISRRIAEAMGGQVGVESEAGEGSNFWVEIPFAETAERPADEPQRDAAGALSITLPPDQVRRILLADDDEVNRLVLGGMLRKVGHNVAYVTDGRQAVREASKQAFDLIIMDMHMPEMDGAAANRAVRTLPDQRAAVPIIGLTADAMAENRHQYMAAGLNELLTKPIRAAELLAVVKRFTEPAEE